MGTGSVIGPDGMNSCQRCRYRARLRRGEPPKSLQQRTVEALAAGATTLAGIAAKSGMTRTQAVGTMHQLMRKGLVEHVYRLVKP